MFEDKTIIRQSLREKCLYNEIVGESYRDGDDVDYDLWFRYMISMRHVINSKIGFTQFASGAILSNLGVAKNVIKHIEDCVDFAYRQKESSMFTKDRYWQNLMRVTTHPTVTINNKTYFGDLDGRDLSIALCASFKERPEVCYDQGFES